MSKDLNFNEPKKENFSKNEGKRSFADDISEGAIKEAISKVLEDVGNYLEDKKGDLCKTGKEYKNKMHEHPMKCALGALALGVIIGAVLKK